MCSGMTGGAEVTHLLQADSLRHKLTALLPDGCCDRLFLVRTWYQSALYHTDTASSGTARWSVSLVLVHIQGASLSDLVQKACPVRDVSDTSIVPLDFSGYVCEYKRLV